MHRTIAPSAAFGLVLGMFLAGLSAQGGLPSSYPGPGTTLNVGVWRDAESWPHIYGQSDPAAFYAFGRTTMLDLPVTTAINLVSASGELAQYVGPGAGPWPGAIGLFDLRTRHWRIRELSIVQWSTMPFSIKADITAYVAGLNDARLEWLANVAVIANNTEPVAFDQPTLTRLLSRPFTTLDVLAFGNQLNGNPTMYYTQQLADDPEEDGRESVIRTASNGWVVGGAATANGRPISLADPHTAIENTPQYRFYFGQVKGSSYEVCGMTIPGSPCITIGYTPGHSWALTSNNPDISDVWKAPTSNGGNGFLVDGAPTPIIRRNVTIKIWDDALGQTVNHTESKAWAADFEHPVLREGADKFGVNSVWFARGSFSTAPSLWEFFIDLGTKRNVPQSLSAAQVNALSYNNILMADTQGNLGYLWAGRVPIRGNPTPGTDWTQVQDGTTLAHRWYGIHPVGDLPWEFHSGVQAQTTVDPADVAWINCNVGADETAEHPSFDILDFPEYMVHATTTPTSYRQVRAEELIRRRTTPLTAAANEAVATDDLNLWFRRVGPLMPDTIAEFGLGASPHVIDAMTKIRLWNGRNQKTLEAPVIVELIQGYLREAMQKLNDLGITLEIQDFDFPGNVPEIWNWGAPRLFLNRLALAYAIEAASFTESVLINEVLTNLTSPSSPWTPTPFQGLPATYPSWGTTNYLSLTPYTAPTDLAIYPMNGGKFCLFTVGTGEYAASTDGLIDNFSFLGQNGPLLSLPVTSGAHTLLQVELTTPPHGRYMEAVGPTEIAGDPRRYQGAIDYSNGLFKPFECDPATLLSSGTNSANYAY